MADRHSRELAETLLGKAAGDLATLRAIGGSEEVPDEAVGLHAQQAVEETLKAVLASRDVHYPFTHDIDRLAELVEEEGIELPDEIGDAGVLTPWALAHRYENASAPGADREEMLALASAAVAWASSLLDRR